MAKLQLIRLLSGEDIVALTDVFESRLVLKNPVRIVVQPGQGGQPQLGMMPWPQFSDTKEINVDRQHVLFITDTTKEISAAHMKLTSGIVLPSSPLLRS